MNATTNNIVLLADGDTAQVLFRGRKITIEASEEIDGCPGLLVSCRGMVDLFNNADSPEPSYEGTVVALHLYPMPEVLKLSNAMRTVPMDTDRGVY